MKLPRIRNRWMEHLLIDEAFAAYLPVAGRVRRGVARRANEARTQVDPTTGDALRVVWEAIALH